MPSVSLSARQVNQRPPPTGAVCGYHSGYVASIAQRRAMRTAGAILFEPSRSADLIEACKSLGLSPEDFSQSANGEIFSTLLRMSDEGKPIDLVLLCDELDVKRIGGVAYLSDLTTGAVPVKSHVVALCRIIKRDARLRRILAVTEQIAEAAHKRGARPEEIITEAVRKLQEIAPARTQ